LIKREKFLKTLFGDIAVSMKENKEIRRFRSLVSGEEGTDKPLYTINKHPRIILRDGVAKVHY